MLTLLYPLLWSYEAVQRNTVRSQNVWSFRPSGIGPHRDPRSVYSRPGPGYTSAFLLNADGDGCVFALFPMPSLWPYCHGIAARALSYDASALLMTKDVLSGVLNHDSDSQIKSGTLDRDPRDLRNGTYCTMSNSSRVP